MDRSVQKVTVYRVACIIVLIVLVLLFMFPLYWMVTSSFKNGQAINANPPIWFPLAEHRSMDNYHVIMQRPVWRWLSNTVIICGLSMLFTCIASSMGGYALAKKKFVGRKLLFSLFVAAMALPKQVILIPLLKQMAFMRLSNTLWGVILPTVGWPFGVFLMKQFSETVPDEMLEAAKIDGATEALTFTQIVLPLIKPGIGALAIFTFISTWNDYFLQLIMLTESRVQTLSLGIAKTMAEFNINMGPLIAGGVLSAVPILTVFLIFQKYFTRGITMGAVKG